MLVKLSMDDLKGLLKLSSLGKLIGGLVHNLNAPLQNLGMDIELMSGFVTGSGHLSDDAARNIATRLKRMEEEYERINALIHTAMRKADLDGDSRRGTDLNEFLQQELSHLTANLYFKHHVDLEMQFQDDLPQLMNLSKYSRLALEFFLQAYIEELEKRKITHMLLKNALTPAGIEIRFTTGEKALSKEFLALLDLVLPPEQGLGIANNNVGMILSLAILKLDGISFTGYAGASGTDIVLIIPMSNPLS